MKKIKIITVLLILLSITLPTFAAAMKKPEFDIISIILAIILVISIILFNIFVKNKKARIIGNVILVLLLVRPMLIIIKDLIYLEEYNNWKPLPATIDMVNPDV